MLPVKDIIQFPSPKILEGHPRHQKNSHSPEHGRMGGTQSWEMSLGTIGFPITEPLLGGKPLQGVSVRGIVVHMPQLC